MVQEARLEHLAFDTITSLPLTARSLLPCATPALYPEMAGGDVGGGNLDDEVRAHWTLHAPEGQA